MEGWCAAKERGDMINLSACESYPSLTVYV